MCWIGIIVSDFYGSISFPDTGRLISLIIGDLGALLLYVSSFVLYGFSQIVDNTDTIATNKIKTND